MLEFEIEQYLKARVAERGGTTRKVKWIQRRGAPDRLVMLPPKRVALIELKQPGEKAKPYQLREHEILRQYFDVYVFDTKEAIDLWLASL